MLWKRKFIIGNWIAKPCYPMIAYEYFNLLKSKDLQDDQNDLAMNTTIN